jgi:hypothetical protein
MSENIRNSTPSFLAILTGAVMVLLFCALAAFLILQRQAIPSHDDAQKEARLKNLAELNAANEKILSEYRWVDKAKGTVGIPIDRAMQLVLVDLQANKPHAAGPVTPPPVTPPPVPEAVKQPPAQAPTAQPPAPSNQ